MRDKLPPTKKKQKPARKYKQDDYMEAHEEYEMKRGIKENNRKKPANIGTALKEAKEGYSKKPRVKPSKKKSFKVY